MDLHIQYIQPYSLSGSVIRKESEKYNEEAGNSYLIYEITPKKIYKKTIDISLIPGNSTEWLIGYNDNNKSSVFMCFGTVLKKTDISLPVFDHYFGVRFDHKGCYFNKGIKLSPTPADIVSEQFSYKPEDNSAEALLITRLKSSDNFSDHLKAFNSFLKESKEFFAVPENALKMADDIIKNRGNITISQLSEKYGYSERQISRIFKTAYGYCPKDFCKYTRFQNVLAEILDNPNRENSEFIIGAGYSDKAHFQREFKAYMGETPKTFISSL